MVQMAAISLVHSLFSKLGLASASCQDSDICQLYYATLQILTRQADINCSEKHDSCSAQSSQRSLKVSAAIGATEGSLRAPSTIGMMSLKKVGWFLNQVPIDPK